MQGKMKGSVLVALLSVLGIILLLVGVVAFSYISASNTAVEYENRITAKYDSNQGLLGQKTNIILETAKVADKYTAANTEVFSRALDARYGEDGSKAMFQWIKEQNPQLAPEVFTKIQQVIESGRNEYTTAQTELADICRSYRNNLDYFWRGMWMRAAGFPRGGDDVLAKKCKVITTAHAADAYATGIEKPLAL